jgi:hypothetical protein
MTIWYILCSFGTCFPVLVSCTKKNLATQQIFKTVKSDVQVRLFPTPQKIRFTGITHWPGSMLRSSIGEGPALRPNFPTNASVAVQRRRRRNLWCFDHVWSKKILGKQCYDFLPKLKISRTKLQHFSAIIFAKIITLTPQFWPILLENKRPIQNPSILFKIFVFDALSKILFVSFRAMQNFGKIALNYFLFSKNLKVCTEDF